MPARLRIAIESTDHVVRATHLLGDVVNVQNPQRRPLNVGLPRLASLVARGWALYGRCNRRRPAELVTTEERFVTCRHCLRLLPLAAP